MIAGGGPANCGLGLPALAGAFAPQATVAGAAVGFTVLVCVPGFALGDALGVGDKVDVALA